MLVRSHALPNSAELMKARPADRAGADALYHDTDVFLRKTLREDPSDVAEELSHTSRVIRESFEEHIGSIHQVPKQADVCRQAAVNALQAGLLAGALDAVLLFVLQEPVTDEAFDGRLHEIQDQAAASLRDLGLWGVSTASRIAQDNGRHALEQASAAPEAGLDPEGYQAYLLGCFTTGYSVGSLRGALRAHEMA